MFKGILCIFGHRWIQTGYFRECSRCHKMKVYDGHSHWTNLCILLLSLVLYQCKTSDLKYLTLTQGKSDYYFSQDEYRSHGLEGYCRVWDRRGKIWKIFPYTYKVTERVGWQYYAFQDLIYLGRGFDIRLDSNNVNNIIKPAKHGKDID